MGFLITQNRLRLSALICLLPFNYSLAQKTAELLGPDVGPIRSIREWDEKYERKNLSGTTRSRRLSSDYFYDRTGKLIEYTTYRDDGGILYGDRYHYDAKGRLTKTETKHSQFVYLPDTQLHSYDHSGKLIETKGFDSTGKQLGGHLKRYDASGNLVEDRGYQLENNQVYMKGHVTKHVNDRDGNKIIEEQYLETVSGVVPDEFGMGYQKQVFVNDSKGRPVLIGYLKANNEIVRTKTLEYDPRGYPTQEVERGPRGRLLRQVRYSYRFDNRGNWTRQVRREWTAQGVGSIYQPLEVTYRTIQYYSRPYDKQQ